MPLPTNRRTSTGRSPDRRLVAAVAMLLTFGGLVGVTQVASAEQADGTTQINGLDVLGQSCANSSLETHGGFQDGRRCAVTAFGEVGAADLNPTLLIIAAPESVQVGEGWQLEVSTRNLVRDRFLGAAVGGYFLESSYLNAEGLQRGHFHVACRMLDSTDAAPAPDAIPAFFRAVEDGGGGATPDSVTVDVPGMPTTGTAQCAVWAGDGSHRVPMMHRANQTPALDAVRIQVVEGEPPASGDNDGDSEPGDSEPGDSEPGDSEPGDSEPGDSEPGDEADDGDEAAERPVPAGDLPSVGQIANRAEDDALPLTGSDVGTLIGLGLIALSIGLIILNITRRRGPDMA